MPIWKRQYFPPLFPLPGSVPFKSMLLYIQEHYHEKVSLEEIADVGSVGKTLCAKLFRTYTSKTPGEYLIHYRIQKVSIF